MIALDGEADMSHVDSVASEGVMVKAELALSIVQPLIPPPHDLAEVSEITTRIRHTSENTNQFDRKYGGKW